MKNHELVDKIVKKAYVWFEDNWIHDSDEHSHKRAQLVYVEKGFQYLHVAGRIYLLPQNHAAWIPSNLSHRTTAVSDNINLRTIFYTIEEEDNFYDKLRIFSVPTVLREIIAYSSKWSKIEEYSIEEEAFLNAIFVALPSFFKDAMTLNVVIPNDERLLQISNFIIDNIGDNLQVSTIAENNNMSLRSLERVFKKETTITISKYIQLVRIIKGIEFLSTGKYTVSQVAYLVGYKSLQAFSSSFFQILNKRPNEFLGV
ncbi:AraC family transcriptional regulator [Flavobacterium sp. LS1R49]|uniref:AraC family transcriptional regulator n=1 Tax=Flavobacterium shii TaxID=2987687 RepID=A0A9X2ZEA6_9FLAO|nr:AraC family transcriptional regulator [Flavobacterium shii]MCV9929776.1 AraC family transcriptional regulator [Flavobacterium shii]